MNDDAPDDDEAGLDLLFIACAFLGVVAIYVAFNGVDFIFDWLRKLAAL